MKTTEKQIEKLKNEWDRLCLYGGGKNLENKLNNLEIKIGKLERELKLKKLGL